MDFRIFDAVPTVSDIFAGVAALSDDSAFSVCSVFSGIFAFSVSI